MKKAGKLPRTTRWAAALWERRYFGTTVWIEEVYTRSPRWEWSAEDGSGGRKRTKLEAMRAAEKHARRLAKATPEGK